MNTAKQMQIMTLEEYEMLPEDERIEVFKGVPSAMATPSIVHQRLVTRLNYLLTSYILSNNGKCETFVAPCDVNYSNLETA